MKMLLAVLVLALSTIGCENSSDPFGYEGHKIYVRVNFSGTADSATYSGQSVKKAVITKEQYPATIKDFFDSEAGVLDFWVSNRSDTGIVILQYGLWAYDYTDIDTLQPNETGSFRIP